MGLFSWLRGGASGGGGVGADGRRQVLDREGGPADLEHLRSFARSRGGVEFFVEPETTATDTTVVAVAVDGEWTRRRVGTPRAAERLARKCGVPIYDVTVTGYPQTMRDWNARAKRDRETLRAWDREMGTDRD
ncbi:hypothetical protein [Actinomycetospora sp. TBRC 11914]|uniref:hypothetical protein n=1 Tax=Actinomycetospora sp. TBRC 11914 TaxID=2729387 RepID=UPI001B7D4EA2|nr:hypothetical protein [Actinomycetospora sp. TBRC 11914]